MAPSRDSWRRLFDAAERAVGEPLEAFAGTQEFAQLAALNVRLRRELEQRRDAASRWLFHRWGVPVRADVAEIASTLARLEGTLQQLSHRVEERDDRRRRESGDGSRSESAP